MAYEIIILIIITFIIRYFFSKYQVEKARQKAKEDSFLVPKDGGVLQRIPKDKDGNIKLKLGKKIKITGDTYIFRFGFTDPDYSFGLPIGQHVIFSATFPTKECP